MRRARIVWDGFGCRARGYQFARCRRTLRTACVTLLEANLRLQSQRHHAHVILGASGRVPAAVASVFRIDEGQVHLGLRALEELQFRHRAGRRESWLLVDGRAAKSAAIPTSPPRHCFMRSEMPGRAEGSGCFSDRVSKIRPLRLGYQVRVSSSDSPVSSRLLRLERMVGQPLETAWMNFDCPRSISWSTVSFTVSPLGSSS